jgi:hypothetical protein
MAQINEEIRDGARVTLCLLHNLEVCHRCTMDFTIVNQYARLERDKVLAKKGKLKHVTNDPSIFPVMTYGPWDRTAAGAAPHEGPNTGVGLGLPAGMPKRDAILLRGADELLPIGTRLTLKSHDPRRPGHVPIVIKGSKMKQEEDGYGPLELHYVVLFDVGGSEECIEHVMVLDVHDENGDYRVLDGVRVKRREEKGTGLPQELRNKLVADLVD